VREGGGEGGRRVIMIYHDVNVECHGMWTVNGQSYHLGVNNGSHYETLTQNSRLTEIMR
jgi:hypothetical protein